MFWWGHFFSCTLHLAGIYKENYTQKILSSISSHKEEIFICVNEDPWQHSFDSDNYLPVKGLADTYIETILQEKSFLKLSAKISLERWDNAVELLHAQFKSYLDLLGL
jgi:hypothetical protein